MTTTKTISSAEAVEAANDARQRLADLTAALTDGDLSISSHEIEEARQAAEFADLRVEGARAAERHAEEARLRGELATFCADANRRQAAAVLAVESAHEQARAVLADLAESIRSANSTIHGAKASYGDYLPSDIPLDAPARDLPDWYREGRPSTFGNGFDELNVLLALVAETVSTRRAATTDEGARRIELAKVTKPATNNLASAIEQARNHESESAKG